MRLAEIVETSGRVAATRSRKAKVEALAACLRRLAPDEIEPGAALLMGAPRQGRIGIGGATLRDLHVEPARAPLLELREVDARLRDLAAVSGPGASAERRRRLAELLACATQAEQAFLARVLLGAIRQGALEGVMIEAIARAAQVPASAVRRAAMLRGGLAEIARSALLDGEPGLAAFGLQLLRPVQPMLAGSAEDAAQVVSRLGRLALEHKLDGARVQVHRRDDEVRVFTRQLNDVTAALPELVDLARALPAARFVLDGEAVALRADGRPEPFQTTMRRFGRRVGVDALRRELPLHAFFFDCLHLDGQDLIDLRADERAHALHGLVPEAQRVARALVEDAAGVEAFLADALAAGHEGAVAKALDAPYAAGRRGAGWLKLKPAHTLDLVVLAAEWGSGRRRGWLSNLHLGARDARAGGFVMLGKTFKGLTDEMLAWQTERFLELETQRDAHTVTVRPEQVVEIAFDGVQESPHYPGGVALRFARVKRYRDDKSAAQADTIETVRALARRDTRES